MIQKTKIHGKLRIPLHLLTIDDAEMLKKVVLHSVATAFASIVCNLNSKFRILTNSYFFIEPQSEMFIDIEE